MISGVEFDSDERMFDGTLDCSASKVGHGSILLTFGSEISLDGCDFNPGKILSRNIKEVAFKACFFSISQTIAPLLLFKYERKIARRALGFNFEDGPGASSDLTPVASSFSCEYDTTGFKSRDEISRVDDSLRGFLRRDEEPGVRPEDEGGSFSPVVDVGLAMTRF
ncbi:uncharacterized protein MELLADRAFT_112707 [Melampsora larici-populina 98AG31]|uniref:Uncharacterized protein n=1 Tax=Melampsora larici-populina (strain 98AG31 / pathotype 3-4-7) TaxID=747676 RepID=F4S7C0_MELLP|nr:uncharacterized protein MELLADRAFT_112707 [Melampsora larici-populina 98AG31]EGF99494.1 hypothetical protein MELLADRAFT_112707 [Melampsora larici-populina 98AG31]